MIGSMRHPKTLPERSEAAVHQVFSARVATPAGPLSELSGVGDAQRADAIASGTIATSCKVRARWNGRVAAFVASPQKNMNFSTSRRCCRRLRGRNPAMQQSCKATVCYRCRSG